MSFDPLARHYRSMEKFLAGGKLQRCRTAFLSDVTAVDSALICGEGSGRFLEAFLKKNLRARVVCLDGSEKMLHAAAKAVSAADRSRVQFIHADILQWAAPAASYDLIVTNFFLDCFQEKQIGSIVGNLSRSALADALWLLADFNEPSSEPARTRARLILWSMYRFFRIATKLSATHLVRPDSFLQEHGFRCVKQQLSEWGLLRADLWRRYQPVS